MVKLCLLKSNLQVYVSNEFEILRTSIKAFVNVNRALLV